jgi:hypothetical protein
MSEPERRLLRDAAIHAARQRQRHRGRKHACQRFVAVVLVDGGQGIAFVQPQPQRVAPRVRRAMQAVIGHGAWSEHDAPTQHVQTPAEIDILEVREVVFVEAAGIEERVAAKSTRVPSQSRISDDAATAA